LLLGGLGTLAFSCRRPRVDGAPPAGAGLSESFAQIEQRAGGRLGVFALDTQTGRQVTSRPDERFAMCSTFKWILAAQVLARVDRSQLSLAELLPYGPSDLLDYAPFARAHAAEGHMSVEAAARAAVAVSDNTAANLLLARLGGPAAFTEFVRAQGDETTRLDRNESMLNANEAGDVRDTTSPRAMVQLMNRLLCGDVLSPASREHLLGWLYARETGKKRLRAGLPPEWKVGGKAGACFARAVRAASVLTFVAALLVPLTARARAPVYEDGARIQVTLMPGERGSTLHLRVSNDRWPTATCASACTLPVRVGVRYNLAVVEANGRRSSGPMYFSQPESLIVKPHNRPLLYTGLGLTGLGAAVSGVSFAVLTYGLFKNLSAINCVDCRTVSDGVLQAAAYGLGVGLSFMVVGGVVVLTNRHPAITSGPER
jgi:beta-lactamase class A